MPGSRSYGYTVPSENDYREWSTIHSLFRARAIDSCKNLLAKYDYQLIQVKDPYSGNVYDVIKEQFPIRRGWGTFIYNRNYKKRLFVHVNHPVDDGNASIVGAEMFRRLHGEWLMIAGTDKSANPEQYASDIARAKQSIFQRWHEMLADHSHVTLSIHGYNSVNFGNPINTTDIVISNGRTSDYQWGISQISLAFRDTMNSAGLRCALAMFDSGLARLAGGGNPQSIFSNDNTGFGRWLNIELSERIRYTPSRYLKMISAAERALDLTGKKISQQMNRAFGLVSPRVVRVDSLRKMLFPPPQDDSYRIISFNAAGKGPDSLSLRFGSWLDFGDAKTISRVSRMDSSEIARDQQLRESRRAGTRVRSTRLIQKPSPFVPGMTPIAGQMLPDPTVSEDDPLAKEPLQVRRIPLQAMLLSTVSDDYSTTATPFKWEGAVSNQLFHGMSALQMKVEQTAINELRGLPNFLIPLIRSSYNTDKQKFVGVQMTSVLVHEIARLVTEHELDVNDVGLFAEESETGDYYLRIFPHSTIDNEIVQIP